MKCSRLTTAAALCFIFSNAVALGKSDVHAAPEKPWFQHALVGMEVGPTGAQFDNSDPTDLRYASRFDGAEIVRRCVTAHCDYVVVWARDGDYAYYNSSVLPAPSGLKGGNPLRQAVTEAHKRHLPVIAYCVVQQGGHYLAAHPEFAMRDIDGKPIGRFCYNSGYLESMKPMLHEMLDCGIDGFHIDMVDQGFGKPYGCWCDACRTLFNKRFGHSMPTSVVWDKSWDEMLEFRYATSAGFERSMFTYIKSVNPKASVDFNYHGNPPFSFEVGQRPVQHAGTADFVTGETGQWGFSALGVGLNAEFYRAATPGKPFQVAMQRGVRMYHDQTTRPLADIRWELFTLLAHGAFVTMVDKMGYEGSLDPAAYERIGEAFAEAHRKAAAFGHKPVYDVGIYFSARSRDWYGRESPARYFQSFEGMQKACVYEHLTYGVILDENVTLNTLTRFPVVCLPNTAILSDSEVSLFQEYVSQGGKLIVTGHSGQFDALGNPVENSKLNALIGATVHGRLESQDNWFRFGKSDSKTTSVAEGVRSDWPFLVEGPATIYQATTAQPIGNLMKPFRSPRQLAGQEPKDWPSSAETAVGPAILLNHYGRGTVITFAGSPDFSTASEHHITETRKLISKAIRRLHPTSRVSIAAPANVETVVTDDPGSRTLLVHCIAYNSLPQSSPAEGRPFVLPGLAEEAPIYRLSIRATGQILSTTAWNRSTLLKQSDNSIEATINDIHEVISIKY